MTATMCVLMLGAPSIQHNREAFIMTRRQNRALFFRLAAQSGPLARNQLIYLFWPDVAENVARRRLTQLLSQLRRALPDPELLIVTKTHVQLRQDQIWSDVVTFKHLAVQPYGTALEDLQSAAALFRGRFLDGFAMPGFIEYDHWLLDEGARLENSYRSVLDAMADHLMAQQAYTAALDVAQRHLALDELAEPVHRRLMFCHAAAGNRTAALQQYEQCAALLAANLNIDPEPETQDLLQLIRSTEDLRALDWSWLPTFDRGLPAQRLHFPATTVLRSARTSGNLPHQSKPLVGRTSELTALSQMFAKHENRLITIVGMGGTGKSHFALEAAWRESGQSRFSDGVYFISLAAVTDVEQMAPAILNALNLAGSLDGQPFRSPHRQLLDFLREKVMLLVLDNCEHLLNGVDLLAEIIQCAPGVVVLATSRSVLGLSGEQIFPLDKLPYPSDEATLPLSGYPAVEMFVRCAQRRDSKFTLSDDNKRDVARICCMVAGMPLALELAAAWIGSISPREIGDEIAGSIDFLATEMRDLPVRHRTIRGVFDTVWQQMDPWLAARFARLSAFRDGFTREAAQQVADASVAVLRDLITSSLIQYERETGRYRVHELLRLYGAQKLSVLAGVKRETSLRHSRYFCALVARLEAHLKSDRQQEAQAALLADRANIRLAWDSAVMDKDWAVLNPCVDGLGYLYTWVGNALEGIAAFRILAEYVDEDADWRALRVQVHALAWLAYFQLVAGHAQKAEQAVQKGLALLRRSQAEGVDTRAEEALLLLHLGHLERPRRLEAAVRAYAESGERYMQLGRSWDAACAWSWLGETLHLIGEQEQAINLLNRARSVFEGYGDWRSVARVLETVAECYLLDRADLAAAQRTAETSLQIRRAAADTAGVAHSLVLLGYVHCWLNQPALADPLVLEALEIFQHLGDRHGECQAYYVAMVVANYQGRLQAKKQMAERGLVLARQLGNAKLVGDFLRGLANVYMAEGDFATAYTMHGEAIRTHEEAGIQALLPWLHVVRAYSSWKVGNLQEAREHINYALGVSAERTDTYTAVHALLFVAQILATSGHLERALELAALAQREFVWEGSLTGERIFVLPLQNLLQDIPPDIAEKARARGLALDLFETVYRLHTEMQHTPWL